LRWWDGQAWTEHASPYAPQQFAHRERPGAIAVAGQRVVLAGWWRRVGGNVLDSLIVGIPLAIAQFAIDGASGTSLSFTTTGTNNAFNVMTHVGLGVAILSALVGVLASTGYAVLLLHSRGQTVGMMAAGIRTIDQRTAGSLSWQQVWVRVVTLFCLTSLWFEIGSIYTLTRHSTAAVFGGWELVGLAGTLCTYLWLLGSPLNQTLHDKVAKTFVILKDREAAAAAPPAPGRTTPRRAGRPGFAAPKGEPRLMRTQHNTDSRVDQH
jgi:uncharacterized RDD family membrane protein YckC